ncbi:MAG TPA: patatin-like phospholipase family protein [Burkholderiales bacterium]|nr:patatin-like phospholipase family protein [Burkholderiales bacterium]
MNQNDRPAQHQAAVIMTGGGARAAYQVGVVRALSELLPLKSPCPFPIICGTSAGAVNAAVLASNAHNFRRGVRHLMNVWKNVRVGHIYRADPLGAIGNSARWFAAALTGGLGKKPVSLLDSRPLEALLAKYLDLGAIDRNIAAGYLAAFSVTCSGYSSGQSVTFYQARPGLENWKRARRIGIAMPITHEHLLASSALPFIFRPVRINREYFGDGSMRQIAPVSPALHLGADRLLVIGVGRQLAPDGERVAANGYPSLAQIAGHALNSIFLDSLEVDLERLQRINRTLDIIPREILERTRYPLRRVQFCVIRPSTDLEKIALAHAHELPRTIRMLLGTVGGLQKSSSALLSYLLFERGYSRELIRLGYDDTMGRKEELLAFLQAREAAH